MTGSWFRAKPWPKKSLFSITRIISNHIQSKNLAWVAEVWNSIPAQMLQNVFPTAKRTCQQSTRDFKLAQLLKWFLFRFEMPAILWRFAVYNIVHLYESSTKSLVKTLQGVAQNQPAVIHSLSALLTTQCIRFCISKSTQITLHSKSSHISRTHLVFHWPFYSEIKTEKKDSARLIYLMPVEMGWPI